MATRGRRVAPPASRGLGRPTGRRAVAAEATTERGLFSYIAAGLSAALLILILAVAVLVIGLPAAVGGLPLTVLTGSMEPGLPPGTLVVMKPTPVDDIRVGDVMTYQIESGKPAVVSHRVIGKTFDSRYGVIFTTQGDNNDTADPPVREVQVRGTLWYSIPLLGWVNNAVNGEARSWLVPVGAGLLFAYAGYTVIAALLDRRRRRRRLSAGSSLDASE
jgi:signal peptidase